MTTLSKDSSSAVQSRESDLLASVRRVGRGAAMGVEYLRAPRVMTHRVGQLDVEVPLTPMWAYMHFRSPHDERELLEDMASEIRADDVVFDGGACLGWFSLVASAAAPDGLVISVEPHPDTFFRLERVLESAAGMARCFNVALSDEPGEKPLPGASVSSIPVNGSNGRGETYIVTIMRGDDLLSELSLPLPNVVKLDVTGAMTNALAGLRRSIADSACRLVYCALRPTAEGGSVRAAVEETLGEAGFVCSTLSRRSKEIVKATRGVVDTVGSGKLP